MDIARLNTNWLAAGGAKLEVEEGTLICQFQLDSDKFEHIDAEDKGVLELYGALAYRLTAFSDLSDGVKNEISQVDAMHQKGGLFELVDSDWAETFDPNAFISVGDEVNEDMCHFVLVLGDKALECFAVDYTFNYEWANEIDLDAYSDGPFVDFLTSFMPDNEPLTRQQFHEHVSMFMETEGDETFDELKREVKEIIANNEQAIFLKIANETEQATITLKDLSAMMEVIVKY
jgi:hypothetical protein